MNIGVNLKVLGLTEFEAKKGDFAKMGGGKLKPPGSDVLDNFTIESPIKIYYGYLHY